LLAGLVAGALVLGLLRLAALPPEHVTHFHANYAVFVDGARLDLSADRFMEDVEKCKANPALMDPPDRVHMHNHDQDVIHVHADAATWGHLFANLRMGLGETWLVTEQGTPLVSSGVKTLKFVLNGELTTEIANRAIRSKDRLLVSYGAETIGDVTRAQFPVVKSNAAEFNEKMDPGSCGARHEETPGERLRRAFWF
jgi:hypothetical protein